MKQIVIAIAFLFVCVACQADDLPDYQKKFQAGQQELIDMQRTEAARQTEYKQREQLKVAELIKLQGVIEYLEKGKKIKK